MRQATTRYRNILMDSARWDDFPFRDGDIVISTPPKCGTTWTQMICALLIFQSTDFPQPLDVMSPWLDLLTRRRDELLAGLTAQRHRRFIKTHTPLDGLPFDERVSYVCVGRDPRDAAISWENHVDNMDFQVLMEMRAAAVGTDDLGPTPDGSPGEAAGVPEQLGSVRDRFRAWGDNNDVLIGLPAMLHHLTTFWQARHLPNVVLLHYDGMKKDLDAEMRGLAARLGIEIAAENWPELVRAAGFDQMRSRSKELTPEIAIWRDPDRFFRRGTSGQWRDLLDVEDLRRYRTRVGELADPELAAWVHRGALVD